MPKNEPKKVKGDSPPKSPTETDEDSSSEWSPAAPTKNTSTNDDDTTDDDSLPEWFPRTPTSSKEVGIEEEEEEEEEWSPKPPPTAKLDIASLTGESPKVEAATRPKLPQNVESFASTSLHEDKIHHVESHGVDLSKKKSGYFAAKAAERLPKKAGIIARIGVAVGSFIMQNFLKVIFTTLIILGYGAVVLYFIINDQ